MCLLKFVFRCVIVGTEGKMGRERQGKDLGMMWGFVGCGGYGVSRSKVRLPPQCLLHSAVSRLARDRRFRVGDVVCPRHSQTSGELRQRGIYRHVNYRVEAIEVEKDDGATVPVSCFLPLEMDPSKVRLYISPVTSILPR